MYEIGMQQYGLRKGINVTDIIDVFLHYFL